MLKRIEEQIKAKKQVITDYNNQILELDRILNGLRAKRNDEIEKLDNLEQLWEGVHEFELVFPVEEGEVASE